MSETSTTSLLPAAVRDRLDLGLLDGKVALITGASRGIGRAVAEALAAHGVHVVAAAKTVDPHPTLPGTIHDTVAACEALGPKGLAVQVDVRHDAQVAAAVAQTVETFGRLDIAIHNAGALWWKPVSDTPLGKFDLVMDVNARGAFALAHHALPHLLANGDGRFMTMSPPVDLSPGTLKGKVAYLLSKYGMTLVAQGLAAEHGDKVVANALWPETLVESAATKNFRIGTPAMWHRAEIVSDAVLATLALGKDAQAEALLTMDVLRRVGVEDFVPYRCVPESEPPVLTVSAQVRAGGREAADGGGLKG